jgi:predicted Na+-dependent transporter
MSLTPNKSWGLRLGAKLDQYLFILILVSLVLGFLFSAVLYRFNEMIPYLFSYVTFIMALGCSGTQIRQALQMRYAMLLVLFFAHVAAPVIAYGLGSLLFGADSPYLIGLVLFAIIPLGVSSVLWVGLSNGNVTFALVVIIIDSALSPFVVPGEISLFFGAHIQFDHLKMMLDLVIIIVIPTFIGIGINAISRGKAKPWSEPISAPTSKLAFLGVILLNAATIRPIAMQVKQDMLIIFPAVLVLVGICYGFGILAARLQSNQALPITMMYTTGMRNNSLGIVLALSFFEARAAVPVLLSILIQQPMASFVHWIVKKK